MEAGEVGRGADGTASEEEEMTTPRGLVHVGPEGTEWMNPGFWFQQRVAFGAIVSDRLHWRGSGFGVEGEMLSSFWGAGFRVLIWLILQDTIG